MQPQPWPNNTVGDQTRHVAVTLDPASARGLEETSSTVMAANHPLVETNALARICDTSRRYMEDTVNPPANVGERSCAVRRVGGECLDHLRCGALPPDHAQHGWIQHGLFRRPMEQIVAGDRSICGTRQLVDGRTIVRLEVVSRRMGTVLNHNLRDVADLLPEFCSRWSAGPASA